MNKRPRLSAAPGAAGAVQRVITAAMVRDALHCIPPDVDRETWVRLGMAVKAELGADGFDLWDGWSQLATAYSAIAAKDTWRSIKAGGRVTVGTLFGIAKDHGYAFPVAAVGNGGDGVQASAPADPAAVAAAAAAVAELAEKKRQQREQEADQYRQRAEAAALEAAKQWAGASDTGASPYLTRKGVAAHGVRFLPDGSLLVPMRPADGTAAGELVNVQRIAPAKPTANMEARGFREKRFLPGGRKVGLLHWVGAPVNEQGEAVALLCLAEGYATAASVHEATGRPVAVCFDAGNLAAVAKALRPLFPAAAFLVCGDDDTATATRTGKNPGRVAAAQTVRALRSAGAVAVDVFPDRGCNDFNDLAAAAGLDAVAAIIAAAAAVAEVSTLAGAAVVADVAAANAAFPGAAAVGAGGADPRPEPTGDGVQAGGDTTAPAKPRKPRQPRSAGAGGGNGGNTGHDGGNGGGNGDNSPPDAADPSDPFHLSAGGVFYIARDAEGNSKRPEWVCARLEVSAKTRTEGADGWGYLLDFADPDDNPKQWAMPAQMLAGDGSEWAGYLRALGLQIAPGTKARNLLARYVDTRRTTARATCVDRVGWHGGVFVLPSGCIGNSAGVRYVYQSEGGMDDQYKQRSTLADWRTHVAALAVGNSRLMFAICCAFAGPLMRLAGIESGGFQFRGDSSNGKTTALKVAASVFGPPAYLQRWRTTDNALEATAVQHCDSLLILDEFGQLDPKVAGECAYMLANEQEKGRATRGGLAKRRRTWRLLFLSSGELGLSDHMRQAGKEMRAGQEVRFVDIPLDAGAGMGGLEKLHGHATAQDMAESITRQAAQHYGTAGRAWVEWLAGQVDTLPAELLPLIEQHRGDMVPESAAAQVFRVGNRFALLAVAGELATKAGLTGWPVGTAAAAVRQCFAAWLAGRGHLDNGEDAGMLRLVQGWLEKNGDALFTWTHRAMDDHRGNTPLRAGFKRLVHEDGQPMKIDAANAYMEKRVEGESTDRNNALIEYLVLPETFRRDTCKGYDAGAVAALLKRRGHLIHEKDRNTNKQRLPGMGPVPVYHLKASVFADVL